MRSERRTVRVVFYVRRAYKGSVGWEKVKWKGKMYEG